jgi:putative tryptophan/tyrosine transport system substrate-binding protein
VSSEQEKNMNKKILVYVFASLFLACGPGFAQQKGKVARVGVLEPGLATAPAGCNSGLRQGLRELGWVDGQNIRLDERHGEFMPERLRDLAADLARTAPDVIWTHSPPAVRAAKEATTTIPIVIGVASDLVEQALVASLARPGGNTTGMELRDLEIIGKRLELLKQAVPAASRVAVLVDPTNSTHARVPGTTM